MDMDRNRLPSAGSGRISAINGQRASSTTCQGWGRGLESLRPLQIFNHLATLKLLPHHCCGARGSTREAGNLKCGRIEHSRWPTRTPARATMAATLWCRHGGLPQTLRSHSGSNGRMNVRSYRTTQPLSSRIRSASMNSGSTLNSAR
jgi:hypothetical protein